MKYTPVYQVLIIAVLAFVIMFFLSIFKIHTEKLINVAVLIFVLFMMGNSILSIFAERYWIYILLSIAAVLIMMAYLGLLISILQSIFLLEGTQEATMAFLVVIFYPITLIITGIIRLFIK